MLAEVNLPLTSKMIAASSRNLNYPGALVVVQHVRPDTAYFLELLITAGWPIQSCIAIPYSSRRDSIARLRRLGIRLLTPSLHDVATSLEREVVRLAKRSDGRLVVHEVGGYLADLLSKGSRVSRLVAGSIEETKQGLWRYHGVRNLTIPVVEIADSPLKEIEARYVGAAVALSVGELLRSFGIDAIGQPMAIIGYGHIGSACARAIRGLGNPVYVYDIDPIRMIAAVSDGFIVADPSDIMKHCRVAIGCSGHQSIDLSWFHGRSGRYFLASGSSRVVEFSRLLDASADTRRVAVRTGYGRVLNLDIEFHDASIMILNSGYPVNFLSESLPFSIIDLVFAQIFAGLMLLTNGLPAGITGLPQETMRQIATGWRSTYLRGLTVPDAWDASAMWIDDWAASGG